MLAIAKALPDTQLVLLCGRNDTLAQALRRLQRPVPQAVLGFTDDVPNLMRLGDFFIGKPGPGCLSEAVQLGLPVITFRNAWTMPQERYNAQWVREQGVGLVLASLRGLPAAVALLLRDLPAYRAATARLHNRAVFELPEILAERLVAAQAVAA
jgi:UDP-N-acetylglucosamine:LPS N-acetylglucosamine transferase